MTQPAAEPSPSEVALLHEADVIIAFAKKLLADGRIAEAAEVAMQAAPRLQAVRSLQRMREAFDQLNRRTTP
jgi:hypothetical protein